MIFEEEDEEENNTLISLTKPHPGPPKPASKGPKKKPTRKMSRGSSTHVTPKKTPNRSESKGLFGEQLELVNSLYSKIDLSEKLEFLIMITTWN